jgi:hypothetical protein
VQVRFLVQFFCQLRLVEVAADKVHFGQV